MNLEEIQALADKDLKLDDTELDIESLKTPELHNKYLKLELENQILLNYLLSLQKYFLIMNYSFWEIYPSIHLEYFGF